MYHQQMLLWYLSIGPILFLHYINCLYSGKLPHETPWQFSCYLNNPTETNCNLLHKEVLNYSRVITLMPTVSNFLNDGVAQTYGTQPSRLVIYKLWNKFERTGEWNVVEPATVTTGVNTLLITEAAFMKRPKK